MIDSPAQRLLDAYCGFVGAFIFWMCVIFTAMELFSSQVVRSSRETDVLGGLCACAFGYVLMTRPPSRTRRIELLGYVTAFVVGLLFLAQAFHTVRPEVPPQGMLTFAALVIVPVATRVAQLVRPTVG